MSEVSNVTIWGNHSATQYPDYYNAKIGGVSAPEVISDDTWAHVDFIPTVQQRGAAIIQARGASSAASARYRNALTTPTPIDTVTNLFPHLDGQNFATEFAREKIDASVNELAEERGDLMDFNLTNILIWNL